MIYDYYLSEAKEYSDLELAKNKNNILSKLSQDKNISDFYPDFEGLHNLPQNSTLIKISFTLKKPYTSKDDGQFHIIENSVVRDKFTGLPLVRPSTWKGHLRFAAERVEWKGEERKNIIKRLFGAKSEEEDTFKGRLYFYPTFFKEKPERDVITPLKRDTRTPARGAIPLEIMKPGSKGEFHLLYVPYPRGENFKEEQVNADLKFLAEALKMMFYSYGFSAKKTSGFGVINKLKRNEVEVYPEKYKGLFTVLISR